MFEPNISIDVSLLAIILGLYTTNSDRNLILVLICALFSHVILTTFDDDGGDTETAPSYDDGGDTETVSMVDDNHDSDTESRVAITDSTADVGSAPVPNMHTADSFKTTVSSGVFDRQLSAPQTRVMDTVYPSSSIEANGKLASARGFFFKSLVS